MEATLQERTDLDLTDLLAKAYNLRGTAKMLYVSDFSTKMIRQATEIIEEIETEMRRRKEA